MAVTIAIMRQKFDSNAPHVTTCPPTDPEVPACSAGKWGHRGLFITRSVIGPPLLLSSSPLIPAKSKGRVKKRQNRRKTFWKKKRVPSRSPISLLCPLPALERGSMSEGVPAWEGEESTLSSQLFKFCPWRGHGNCHFPELTIPWLPTAGRPRAKLWKS